MAWTELLLSWVDTPLCRAALRWTNKLLRLPRPVPVNVCGHKVYAASIDRILALMLARLGNAERFEMDLWSASIEPGMVVADVGANLGLYTLLASRRVGPQGCVHSFEPDPDNFALLQRNVAVNGCTNVVLHQAAVSDEVGHIHLHRCEEHHGDHRIYAPDRVDRPTVEVRVTTLDAALGDNSRLDMVKMDIQGCEWRAVEGMKRLLATNPSLAVILEFWPRGLRESGADPAAFLRRLRELGLHFQNIDSGRATLEELDDAALIATAEKHGYANLLTERRGTAGRQAA